MPTTFLPYSHRWRGHIDYGEFENPLASTKCFHLLSLPTLYDSGYPNIPEFLEYLVDSVLTQIVGLRYSVASVGAHYWAQAMDLQVLNLFDPIYTHHSKGFNYSNPNETFVKLQRNVETELLQCRKSVFISTSDIIGAELAFLSKYYSAKRFYKGKETFATRSYRWLIVQPGWSNVPYFFEGVVESGIYRRLQLEEIHQKNLRRKPVRKEQDKGSLALDGAILTLFILCGGTISSSSLVFIGEIRQRIVAVILKPLFFFGNQVLHIYYKCRVFYKVLRLAIEYVNTHN